jgi:DNA-binding transcriptional MerR regulator
VSARSYLSIGDVLTLLRQEFPDVTISKIRFLESQGLVNPERTPSGYRKFYEHDVERLRWVLRQQREHFLPLKVIKDRLDDEGDEATAPPTGASATVPVEEPVLVGQRTATEGGEVRSGAPTRSRTTDEAAPTAHSGGTTLPGIEGAAGASANGGAPADGTATARSHRSAPDRATAARATPPAEGRPAKSSRPAPAVAAPPSPDPVVGAAGRGQPRAAAPATPPSTPPAGAEHSAAAGSGPTGEAPKAPTPKQKGAAPRAGSAAEATTPPTGATLSLEELATASGLGVPVLEELVDFGLLAGTTVAGQVYFDREGLAVATVAAGFARFGVEPRHLRLYKNAADREAGFVEQIVLPLVRQRNPEAKVRAHETVDELAQLGQQLRASLLRSALGNLLDG